MARRHKGNKVGGWVVVDKPAGVTSIQALAKARWAFRAGKAGHAGTLDPLASGVLAIAFGEATKTVALAQDGLKRYRFTIRLGQATATDDAEGAVIAASDHRPTDAGIEAALNAYVGDIEQVPPQFSAVKVAGERAYDLAREGVVGTDYREFTDYYICSSCNDKFPNPLFKLTCLDCGNVFLDKLASWKKNKLYKIQI
jgi:tRNA pseudouridine55 synthase